MTRILEVAGVAGLLLFMAVTVRAYLRLDLTTPARPARGDTWGDVDDPTGPADRDSAIPTGPTGVPVASGAAKVPDAPMGVPVERPARGDWKPRPGLGANTAPNRED